MKKEKTTIKDVAKAAGVSISTVSNALNDVDVLKADTKAHILAVAEELNYVPNLNGQLLKSNRTKMLGFFTTSVSGPYFYKLVEAMAKECERLGYVLSIQITSNKNMILNHILGRRFDGNIIFEQSVFFEEEEALLAKENIQTVYLDRKVENKTSSSVVFDSFQDGYEMTCHLISLGHKKIAFIKGFPGAYDGEERLRGFQVAMEESGLGIPEAYLLSGRFEEAVTYQEVKRFIETSRVDLPDAFMAANDLSAIGCIKALKDEGYVVPDDFSVTGFDDIEIAEYFPPPLTTIRNPIARQGVVAIQQLVQQVEQQAEGKVICLEGDVVIRKSSFLKR